MNPRLRPIPVWLALLLAGCGGGDPPLEASLLAARGEGAPVIGVLAAAAVADAASAPPAGASAPAVAVQRSTPAADANDDDGVQAADEARVAPPERPPVETPLQTDADVEPRESV